MARQWQFVADMNGDGFVTISDVWAWAGWLFFYPGDYAIYLLLHNSPELARFLELTPANYGGVLSFLLSLFAWLMAFAIVGAIGGENNQEAQKKPVQVLDWDVGATRNTAYKECPKCAMFNSHDATTCYCGYDFENNFPPDFSFTANHS